MTICLSNLIFNTSLISDFIRFTNRKLKRSSVALSYISSKVFFSIVHVFIIFEEIPLYFFVISHVEKI